MKNSLNRKALIYTNHDEDFLNSRVNFIHFLKDKYNFTSRALVPNGELKQEVKRLNLSTGFLVKIMKLSDFWKLPVLIFQLIFEIIRFKPDMIFTYKFVPNFLGVLIGRILGVDFICVTLAGLGRFFSNNKKPTSYELAILRLYIYVIDRADLIVVQNFEDFLFIQSWCKRAKIMQTDGSGVDEVRFNLNYSIPKDFYQEYNLSTQSNYFLYCGRIMEEKGVFELIEGFKTAKRLGHLKNWELIIAGWFPNKSIIPRFNDQTEGIKSIHFLGYINDVRPLLKLSQVSVLPTNYPEGVPRILIESLAFGLPIITTDNKGSKETCSFNNGIILSEKSNICLAQSLIDFEKFTSEEYQVMSNNSRSLFENRFCSDIIYHNILKAVNLFYGPLQELPKAKPIYVNMEEIPLAVS